MTAATARCPSDLALEGYLLQPERSPVAPHVAGCPHCGARVSRMQADGEEFQRYVFPATVDAIQAATPTWRERWRKLVGPVAALATVGAAALLVLRVGPAAPPADYVGTKGAVRVHKEGSAGLKVFVGTEQGAQPVADGAVVPAGASLRFSVKADEDRCFLWLAAVDARGQISRIFPPQGVAPTNLPAGPVPGGAVLDGQPGLERIFAVCADDAGATWEDVRRAVGPAAGGEAALRSTRVLGAPLADECQSSLLLEKR